MRNGMPSKVVIAAALAACGLLALGTGWPQAHEESWKVPPEAKNLKNPVPPTADNLATAHAIYLDKCQKCHGDKGLGDGPEADMYDPQPANLADAHMMSEMTDGEIYWKITEGRKPMPSFKKDLSDEQRWMLVNFLRTLAAPGGPGATQH
jgi:mono/diheme cytochrome c family protein